MPEVRSGAGRSWPRALALLGASAAFSVLNPGVLVSFPLLLLVVFMPARRTGPLLAAVAVAAFALGVGSREGLWYLERGWALLMGGWFVALTLRWPGQRFLPRGLGALAGSVAVLVALFSVRPGEWAVADWMIRSRMEAGMRAALEALRLIRGPQGIPEALEASVAQAIQVQGAIFPALVALASLSALGVAWWAYLRMARSEDPGLGPLKGLRFSDQLVWVLILGLGLLLGSSGALERVGTNAVVFMGALYALRGAGVVLFLTGGVSLFGALFLAVGFVFVAPFLMIGAMVIGLGDTWLNLRARRGEG